MGVVAVLGAGKIGEALLEGLLAAGRTADELVFTERHPERAAELTPSTASRPSMSPTPRRGPRCWSSP